MGVGGESPWREAIICTGRDLRTRQAVPDSLAYLLITSLAARVHSIAFIRNPRFTEHLEAFFPLVLEGIRRFPVRSQSKCVSFVEKRGCVKRWAVTIKRGALTCNAITNALEPKEEVTVQQRGCSYSFHFPFPSSCRLFILDLQAVISIPPEAAAHPNSMGNRDRGVYHRCLGKYFSAYYISI